MDQYSLPSAEPRLSFDARGFAPIGYAVFAFTFATVAGLVLRRTLPAMALTLAVFAAVQLLVPNVIRAHYLPPEKATVAFTTEARDRALGLDTSSTPAFIADYKVPGTWAISRTSEILKADGTPVDGDTLRACMQPAAGPQAKNACLDKLGLHFDSHPSAGEPLLAVPVDRVLDLPGAQPSGDRGRIPVDPQSLQLITSDSDG
ncbi:hypothetical protein [Streptomyces brasiliensis]|uniref:Uncharacterized protein n=1 Tax=Streptomyces brasiliensis TaxID=1954 RepID=A0A917UNI3_9ACTN|nr:hypothetical protein [Streptomyces brasiliensis]GGJ70652.1 hypothetical protein GCM10010121_096610 [Streptomyces brasiliensis]